MYQPLFQQKVLNVDQASPSYSWFEFLIDPSLIKKHIHRIRNNPLSSPSALELISVFLEEADTLSLEGSLNARYYALLDVAAQLVVSLVISLKDIESSFPIYCQWPLLEGVMRCKSLSRDNADAASTYRSLNVTEARIYRNIWILRTTIEHFNQSCNLGTTAEESKSFFLEIEKQFPLTETLTKELERDLKSGEVRLSIAIESFADLGEFYFASQNFQMALIALRSAKRLGSIKDLDFSFIQVDGYIAACEAILEDDAMNTKLKLLESYVDYRGKSLDALSFPLRYTEIKEGEKGLKFAISSTVYRAMPQCTSFMDALLSYCLLWASIFVKKEKRIPNITDITTSYPARYKLSNDEVVCFRKRFIKVCESMPFSLSYSRNSKIRRCEIKSSVKPHLGDILSNEFTLDAKDAFCMAKNLLDVGGDGADSMALNFINRSQVKLCATLLIKVHEMLYKVFNISELSEVSSVLVFKNIVDVFLPYVKCWRRTFSWFISRLSTPLLGALASICAGILKRGAIKKLSPCSIDLSIYPKVATLIATLDNKSNSNETIVDDRCQELYEDIQLMLRETIRVLNYRLPLSAEWHLAHGDLVMDLSSEGYSVACREFLFAGSLRTSFFCCKSVLLDNVILERIICRMIYSLVKVADHVEAAVLCQTRSPDVLARGIQILKRMVGVKKNEIFFQYLWQIPYVEVLAAAHDRSKDKSQAFIRNLEKLIQSPELNLNNALRAQEMEKRIAFCFFRKLSKQRIPEFYF